MGNPSQQIKFGFDLSEFGIPNELPKPKFQPKPRKIIIQHPEPEEFPANYLDDDTEFYPY